MQKLNIHAFSTALFSTWYFIEEWGLLFDAGDGVAALLMQKSRKIKHIFVSHPDRDHLTGLFHLNQLNARKGGFPHIYYPKDSGSFPYMKDFSARFDEHTSLTNWTAIDEDSSINFSTNLHVRPIRNRHMGPIDGRCRSLSFFVEEEVKKLKAAYLSLKKEELIALRKKVGIEELTETKKTILLCYSGDTPIETDGRYDGVETLIHEATFLHRAERSKREQHSNLEEVIEMAAQAKPGRLVLGHFSSRYSQKEIDEAIYKYRMQYELQCPVYRVLPGKYIPNIFTQIT